MKKSILTIDTPNVCIDCPCHFAGESGTVMCGVEKRELLSDDIETYKAEWCPLKEQKADRGGWIPCSDRLPEEKGWYLAYAKNQRPFVAYFKGKTFPLNNHYHEIVAWTPLPEAYHEQMD